MVALASSVRSGLASVGRVFAAADPFNDRYYSSSDGSYTTAAGVVVTPPKAIEHSAVYACLQLLANGTIGTPLKVFRKLDDGSREVARQHPLYRVLNEAPNPFQTAATWKSQLVVDLLLYGNYYAQLRLDRDGNIESLWPIHPDSITKVELLPSGSLRYTIRQFDSLTTPTVSTTRTVNGEDILHVKGLSLDGLTGLPLLSYAKNAIGLGLAAGSYGAGFFSRAPRPAGLVTHPGNLSPEAMARFKAKVEADHGGANAGKSILVLDEGVKWEATPVMGNDESELIETLRWSTVQVCQYFGVPPHLIGEMSGTTTLGSSMAESNVMFFMLAMGPRFTVIQEECDRALLTDEDRTNNYYVEFVPNALQWMTPKQRAEFYQLAAGGPAPWMTRARIRELENEPFIAGTEVLLQPLNMGGNPDTMKNQAQPNPANGQAVLPSPSSVRARLVLEGVALRLARKEIAAITRQATRATGDHFVWWDEVDAFYDGFAAEVARSLHLPAKATRNYYGKEAVALKTGGVKAMLDWETTRVVDLLALVDREKWEDQ